MPFSPVLLAGLLARPLPHHIVQPAFRAAMKQMLKKHPDVFERMISVNSPRFLIDPIDLPFSFVMDTHPQAPTLEIVSSNQDEAIFNTQASIRGPLVLLIELLEGRIDGDALFFSRDIIVEGDTEAILALRNAVDGAEIQVHEDFLGFFGPLAKPVDRVVRGAGSIFKSFTRDLEILSQAILAPLFRKYDIQEAALNNLEETVLSMKKQLRRSSGKTS